MNIYYYINNVSCFSDQDLVSKSSHKMETQVQHRPRVAGPALLPVDGAVCGPTHGHRRQTLALQLPPRSGDREPTSCCIGQWSDESCTEF